MLLAVFLACIFDAGTAHSGVPGVACEQFLERYSTRERVPLGVLYAVGMTETGKGGKLHPYALNIEGVSFVGRSKTDALHAFLQAKKEGKKLIDLGCMQVNHHYHGKQFASVSAMLDPETNIAYAAKLLRQLYQQHGSWTVAVARYHASPRNTVAQKRYICAVVSNLVATGFGNWTPESKAFCGKK